MNNLIGLNAESFLQTFWQKQPGYFPGGFSHHPVPFSPDEFRRWAGHSSGMSRLVTMPGFTARSNWHSMDGPFTRSEINRLPDSGWTLLVSETDRMTRTMDDLKSLVSFLPAWRIDDVMVSWSPAGGSVGPHTDEYDVFLIQLGGRKRWRYSENPVNNPKLIHGINLKILKRFPFDHEVLCNPGDVLYLPPGVAHEGVALEEGYTISIGFRAPSIRESAAHLISLILDHNEDFRFSDKGRNSHSNRWEFPDSDRRRMVELTQKMVDLPVLGEWMVSQATASKRGFRYSGPKPDFTLNQPLTWKPGVRRVWIRESDGVLAAVEGQVFRFSPEEEIAVQQFLESAVFPVEPFPVGEFRRLLQYCSKNRLLSPVSS